MPRTAASPFRSDPEGPMPATSALLIIDMINLFDFTGGRALATAAEAIAPSIARLRRRFRAAGAPVVYVNDNFAHWHADFHALVAICSHPKSPGAGIAALLEPDGDDYFVLKPKHSAFLATPLTFLLASLGVRRLVVTGIAADACIVASAIDAHARDYEVEVVRDGVAARTPELAADALSLLRRSGAAKIVAAARVRP
jgi:nicotinamidase-related amidase